MSRIGALVLVLIISLILPASGVIYKGDVDISKKLEPSKSYYLPGEVVNLTYSVEITNEGKTKELIGKRAEVCTLLNIRDLPNDLIITVFYLPAGTVSYQGDEVRQENGMTCSKFKFRAMEGVSKFKIFINGTIPRVEKRLEDINALYLSVENFDEGVIENVTLRVFNKDKFESDLYDYEKMINSLEKDFEEFSKQYKAAELEAILNSIKLDYGKAKDYFRSGDYVKSQDYLQRVDGDLESYNNKKNKIIAEDLYKKISQEFSELEELLNDIEVNLTLLYKQGKIDAIFYNKYDKKLTSYRNNLNDVKSNFENVKTKYYNLEIYNKSADEFRAISSDLSTLKQNVLDFNDEINTFFMSPSKPAWSLNFDLITGNLLYIALAAAAVIVVIALLKMRGRGRRWDELK